jgi:hypothetical protein
MAKNFWEKDEIFQPPKTASTPWESDPIAPEEQPSQLLDPAKMFASGVVGPTAAIPMGLESAVRNIPRQVVEQQGIAPVDKIGPLTFAKELVRTGPAQLLTNTARAFIKKATGESFEEQQEKQKQNEITIDRAISNIPRVPGLSQLADAGKKVSEDLRESVSAAGQKAIEDSQVEGNILESIQNRSVDNLSFGKDPSFKGYALQASQVLGSLVPIIGTAVMTKGNAKAVGTVGFGMGAGEAVQDATEYVGKLSDEQLMQSSPYFKKMVEDGIDPVEARKVVTDKAAEYAAQLQGSVAAFGGVITGKLITGQFDKLITGPVKSRLGRIALGVTAGSLEEGTQEFLEGVAKDLGINKTVIKEIGEESFANFVLGSIGGAGPGAYRGAVAKKKEEAEQPKLTKEQQDAEMAAALSGQTLAPEVTPVDPSLAVTPAAVPSAIITEEELETDKGLTPVSPTPPPVTPAAVTPTVAPTPPTPPAAPVAATAEIAQRIKELDAELKQIDAAYATATPDQFGELNARQGEIKSEISRLFQAGTTGAPVAAAPTVTPVAPAKVTPTAEVIEEPLETLDSTNPENIKKVEEIAAKLQNNEDLSREEDDFRSAVMRDVMTKEEKLKSPTISKKSVIPHATIEVAPFAGGFVSSFAYNEFKKGLGVGTPLDISTVYPTRQEAIDAVAKEIRDRAQQDGNKIALKWLDTVATPVAAPAKAKTQAEINRDRQAEKKAAAEKAAAEKAKAAKPTKLSDTLSGQDLVDMFVPDQYKKSAQEYVDANLAYKKAWEDMDKIEDKDERQQFMNNVTGARGQELDAIGRKLPKELVLLLSRGMATESLNQQQEIISAYEETTAPKKPAKKAEAKKKPAKEVQIKGKKSEPVTPKTIEKAIDKAVETVDYAKLKKSAENQIDQAIKRTKFTTQQAYNDAKISEADRFVTIKLEGDGSFKVMNNKERLEEFKKKLVNAIKPKQVGTPRRDWESAAVGFKAESAFKNFLNEQEPDTAVAIANLTGLDITKVTLNPTQRKVLDRYLAERKETGGEEPMMETIKSKPGANVARIAKLLGPQLYGSMSNITDVSVKEMLQNSFDAIKTMIEQKKTDFGKIDIVVDKDQRTVAMTDDGSGMSPDTLANTFLTIAGTKKDTQFGSGGFGIAKMLFLFGNEDVEVMTMKDGKISSMYAKGGQLMASLEDPSLAPEITILTKDEMPDWSNMFPKGHGTFVRVTVPKQFKDQSTGEMKEIDFPNSPYSFEVLQRSPLFSNIEVTFNGTYVSGMGSNFYANEYTTFVDANFDWGTARIYVSNDQRDAHGKNMQILSNGLWQFSDSLKLDPMDIWGKNIPHRFYLDIVSKVKPDEEGYPFQLNRQGFTKEAEADLKLIKNYLVLHYRQKDYDSTVQNFGTVQYLSKSGKEIIKSPQESLVPETEEVETKEGIKEGSSVEVKDGKLIVNGKEVPLLTPEDLKKASIDIDALRVPQEKIDPNKVMIHDNLEVVVEGLMKKADDIRARREEIYQIRNKLQNDIDELTAQDAEGNKEKITKLDDERFELWKEQDKLYDELMGLPSDSKDIKYVPITTLARDKFGDRFDKFMFDIGDAFMALRDATASLMPPDKRGNDYSKLAKEAIGISFDKEYRGVSITLPFNGLFINPAFPEFIDTPEEAALGMFGTMIHELAHHKVRNHGADFPAEMQRILIKLESSTSFDVQQLKKDFILTVKENKDIIDFLNKEGSYESNRPIGQRFKDSQQQARGEGTAEDVPGGRQEQRREPGLPSESGQRAAAAGEKQKPKPVSSEDKTKSIEEANELLDKHSRPDAPRKPSLSVRDTFMGGYGNTKKTVEDVLKSPLIATNNMIGQADRALTYFRNKNIFFGYGLEEADRQRYGGQIRNAHQQAIASVAVVNALHSGNIATQVITLGKLEFDPNIQMFVAKKSDKNMANVVREKAKLIDKLGFDTGNRVIQSYFEAKRSRSIVNEYLNREAAYVAAVEDGQNQEEAGEDLANIEAAIKKVKMNDEAMDDFIALENKYPELKNMMENWTAVNQNMIDMMEFSGIISKQRAKALRNIKDYVPWYRIMDEQEDVHSAPKGTRGLTNVAADKKFGPGKTERDIDDIVDNMIHNVLTITRNSARNYAANRIVMEYGERYKEGKNAGKLRVFPKDGSDADGVRFNIIANGRRIVVRIQDPLVAESVIGMENLDIPMNGALAFMANTLRRSITTFPAFQVAQLFMDAPTAALVTGLKRPDKVWAGVFTSFLKNVRKDDPIVAKLRAAGIGGYQSSARTPEKEIQLDIGLIQGSWFSKAMKGLDRFGDASDYAQRRSVYLQTMKETNDEMLALFQANNVIDFKKRGSGQIAQLVTKQVAFMNAYAQAIDVLAKGLAGTGLKGIDRKKALARMATTGMLLASATLVYSFLVGDDEEYNKLDDQTKMRNIFIPGLNIRLPMHSGAAFFFKAIPELLYNAITKEGTKDEYDRKRLTRALSKAAADALLGPNVTPTGVKPVVEIALNRNFFTGGQVTPRGMEDLAAFRQYNQNTSELGKIISALTGTEKTRLLNPIEADHLVRGLTGTVGAAVMWGTNLLAGDRPTPQARENPLYGQFIMPDVPRGREDLYYDLKSKTDEAYKTYMDLQKKQRKEEAADWFKENKKLIQVYDYTSSIEADLKRLNGEIRRLSDLPKEKMSPDAKRKRMTELQEIKGRMLKDVISMRKRAGFDD